MTYLPIGFFIALGEARSCLAAVADSTDDVDVSAHFDRLLLIELNFSVDAGPACSPMARIRAEFVGHLEDAADRLVDGLSPELLLVAAAAGRVP